MVSTKGSRFTLSLELTTPCYYWSKWYKIKHDSYEGLCITFSDMVLKLEEGSETHLKYCKNNSSKQHYKVRIKIKNHLNLTKKFHVGREEHFKHWKNCRATETRGCNLCRTIPYLGGFHFDMHNSKIRKCQWQN